ncbi:zona pellucida sperm-binding protein 4-like isoform X3 [Corythoichthys intestinalis]|uniref:zona pellucida sperm-binding protein 4-like isoform X3 n=1 Tax=Corythoichthys intestinalis TaxID=161448 RepID=UPI0025A5E318|nr:zona pellucida sperm-binding protein 4-like isoform X3 [Corythoichthys intestinalis]XP_061812420.1 zona pellucida sperm-binding protein 4-like [Nerophis lumbriciformis]
MRHSPAMKPIGVLALSLLACVATAQIAKQWTQRPSTPVNTKHCEVAPHHKIRCGPATISISECEKIGCCFDGNVCYYGRHVTLQCTQDGQMIVVISREATIPRVDLESISFITNEPGCRPVDTTSAFAIYQFPVTACGTVVTEEPGLLIYENAMSAFYEVSVGSYGAITRDSRFELAVQCRYVGTSVLALIMEVDPIPEPPPVAAPGPLNVQLRLGNGKRMAKGQMDEEVVFNYFYVDSDYPVTKELREPVYVEVRILGRTDPNLVLNLRRCWATGESYPHSVPQWDLLVHGCPYRDDRYRTTLVRVDDSSGLQYPSHYRRFFFKMFTFVSTIPADPSKGGAAEQQKQLAAPTMQKIFIHCETTVCTPHAGNNCEPQCFRGKRDLAGIKQTNGQPDSTLVSSLEIRFVDPN